MIETSWTTQQLKYMLGYAKAPVCHVWRILLYINLQVNAAEIEINICLAHYLILNTFYTASS